MTETNDHFIDERQKRQRRRRWLKRTTTLTTNVDSNAQRNDVDNFKIDDLQYSYCVNVKKTYYDYGDAD